MRRTGLSALMAAAALTLLAGAAAAQAPPAAGQLKQIGTPSAAGKSDLVPSLIVMNSRGAALQGQTLTLTGVSPNSIIFADRPVRSAGHAMTAHLIEEWGSGSDSFAKDPPNATISVFSKDSSSVKDAVVVLSSPKLEGDKLSFTVRVLEGNLAEADGPASLFIDIIGLPFTPLSFAGAARRATYRGAFYAGAAAAAGAAAYPYAPYYRPPPCGYYPYPPCY